MTTVWMIRIQNQNVLERNNDAWNSEKKTFSGFDPLIADGLGLRRRREVCPGGRQVIGSSFAEQSIGKVYASERVGFN